MSGQTLTDRIAAAQYTLTGSEVARAVCKASTHEQTAPKKKHLEWRGGAGRGGGAAVSQLSVRIISQGPQKIGKRNACINNDALFLFFV
ncbi:Clathrin coat assembly protein AP180 [Liparis tanakae]|uniref:Clathrin coat assembly protein AP180 n=1 Tax=Liparis tanakae TaxID=230148 RepID=A0A4Z2GY75_9TELE|nr:Clathrin coat assembly protein AP180 [Liparis tanakae]